MECLAVDQQCFSVWRQVYTKEQMNSGYEVTLFLLYIIINSMDSSTEVFSCDSNLYPCVCVLDTFFVVHIPNIIVLYNCTFIKFYFVEFSITVLNSYYLWFTYSLLLEHFARDWNKVGGRMDKNVMKETIRAFSITNEELASQGHTKKEGYSKCVTSCKVKY